MTLRIPVALGLVLALALTAAPAQAGKAEKEAIELYKKGVQLGNERKLDEAIAAFQEAIKKAPKFDLAYLKLGLAYEMSDRWPEALACYDEAVKVANKKRKPDAHFYLGRLYRKMGLFELAVESQKEALKAAKKIKREGFAKPHYEMALCFIEMKLLSDAVRELRAVLEVDAEDMRTRLRLANTLVVMEQYDEAETEYDAILAKETEHVDAIFGMGLVEKKRGNKKAAKEHFKRACALGNRKACEEARTRYRVLR